MRRTIGVLSLIVGTLLVMGVNNFGLWYLTLAVGLILGLLPLRAGVSVWISAIVGLCGWGLSLWMRVGSADARPVSGVIASVMGFGKLEWWIPVAVTLIVGLLLSLAGTWVGRAVRSLAWPATRRRPGSLYSKSTRA